MPQYFTGNSPESAFAGGLMAGYEFIDRIKARNEQLRLQRLQEQRSAEAFEMQKEGFATQQEALKLNISRTRTTGAQQDELYAEEKRRRPTVQKQQDDEAAARLDLLNTQDDIAEFGLQSQKDLVKGRGAYGELLQDYSRRTLGGIGAQGTQSPGSAPAVTAPVSPPASTPATPAPPNPLDLRAKQTALEAEPGPLRKLVTKVTTAISQGASDIGKGLGAPSESEFWRRAANPEVSKDLTPAAASVAANIRTNPLPHAPDYLRDRDKVRPEDRPALDYTMSQAASEEAARLTAEMKSLGTDQASKLKLARLQGRLQEVRGVVDSLSKAMGKTVGAEVLPNGGVVEGKDPAVLPAVTKAARNNEAAGVLPRVTEQSLRLTQTQLGRMDRPERLTQKQLNLLSEAFRSGAINEVTYNNWLQYGGPLAPAKPQVIPFGGGKGIVLYPNGQLAEIDFGSSKGGKGGKGSGDDGASFGQAMEFMKDTLNARIKRGDIPDAVDGTGIHEMGQMMLFMQRYATDFQARNPEVELLEDGEMSMEWTKNPLDALKVINYYVNRKNGLDEPDETVDPLPDGPGAMPETPLVQ